MAAFYGASDIDVMLSEFGVPVEVITSGTTYSGKGIVDTTDEDRLSLSGPTMAGTFTVVVVKTGVFIGLVEGARMTVDGTNYIVTQQLRTDDGAITRVYLVEE